MEGHGRRLRIPSERPVRVHAEGGLKSMRVMYGICLAIVFLGLTYFIAIALLNR